MGSVRVRYLIERSHKGVIRYYWSPKSYYVRNGKLTKCPLPLRRLRGTLAEIHAEAESLNLALDAWLAGDETRVYTDGMVGWLVTEYRKSPRFKDLAPSTQQLYMWTFPVILDWAGDLPAKHITRQMAAELYEDLVAGGKKRKPSQVMQLARVVFQYGFDKELIDQNPFKEQRVKKAKARQTIIPPEAIPVAKSKALELGLPSIARAIQLGYDAGQRPIDIRMLPRGNYDGKWLRIRQSKTGALVDIPVYKIPSLKAELDNIAHDSLLILHEERTGKAYSKDMLCRRVREVFEAAGLGSDVQFRDLRRTAVVRLAEAGCTIPEICSITGHSLKEATEILKVYLPMTREMAENAIEKLNKR